MTDTIKDVKYKSVGSWERDGCSFITTTDDRVVCKCSHLTNFAVLFDVSQKQYDPEALSYITWIGCSISLVGLFLTILTYSVYR